MTVYARAIGLIAMFWTNWVLSTIGFVILLVVYEKTSDPLALIRNDKARSLVELSATFIAVLGLWYFPLLEPVNSHLIAMFCSVFFIIEFLESLES